MNYYEMLEIAPNASEEVIKAAYKAQVVKYHPDNQNSGNKEKMAEVNEAYETLSNPVARAEYDRKLGLVENIGIKESMERAENRSVVGFQKYSVEKEELARYKTICFNE